MQSRGFLLGRISGTKEAPENPGRRIIQLSEYADIDIPNGWTGQQNPIRYTSLSELGIDPDKVEWKPFPMDHVVDQDHIPALTIEEAKRGLAKKLGVTPDCVEITIRA